MTNKVRSEEDREFRSLLSLDENLSLNSDQRQQDIMQGVRWLAMMQELIGLYLLILPKVFINLFLQLAKHDKETKNGN